MKNQYKRKFKRYPMPTFQKISLQQWNVFSKTKNRYKRFFNSKFRFFSLEIGRPLSKRVLWQVSLCSKNQRLINKLPNLEQNTKNLYKQTDIEGMICSLNKGTLYPQHEEGIYPKITQSKPAEHYTDNAKQTTLAYKNETDRFHINAQTLYANHNVLFTFAFLNKLIGKSTNFNSSLLLSRTMFRSAILRKMWVLNNTSLVPGSIWLKKTGKIARGKMRAFKTLSELFGNGSIKYVTAHLTKLWNNSLKTVPPLWFIASGIDCLKPTVLLKSGFQFNIPTTSFILSRKEVCFNGYNKNRALSYSYPGDILSVPFSTLFGKLMSVGASSNTKGSKVFNSVYTNLPFVWISPFFKDGTPILKKSSLKKQKHFLKKSLKKPLH